MNNNSMTMQLEAGLVFQRYVHVETKETGEVFVACFNSAKDLIEYSYDGLTLGIEEKGNYCAPVLRDTEGTVQQNFEDASEDIVVVNDEVVPEEAKLLRLGIYLFDARLVGTPQSGRTDVGVITFDLFSREPFDLEVEWSSYQFGEPCLGWAGDLSASAKELNRTHDAFRGALMEARDRPGVAAEVIDPVTQHSLNARIARSVTPTKSLGLAAW